LNGEEVSIYDVSYLDIEFEKYLYGLFEFDKKYYALFEKGLFCLDKNFNFVSKTIEWRETQSITRKCIHQNRIYFTDATTVSYLDLLTKEYKKIHQFDYSVIISDLRMIDDVLYISCTEGVFIYKDGEVKKYREEISAPISAIAIDDKGNEWYASLTRGVIQNQKSIVKPTKYGGLDNISYIEKIKDNILIGSNDGNFYKGQLENLEKKAMTIENQVFPIIGSFFIDTTHWFLTSNYIFNRDESGINVSNRDVLYSAIYDKIYIANGNGVFVVKSQYFKEIPKKNITPNLTFFKKSILPIYQSYKIEDDSDGNVWVGAEEGLFKIKDTSFVRITKPEFQGSIVDIEIRDDKIFGVNYGVGVFVYNIKEDSCLLFQDVDGLISNKVTKIVTDLPHVFVAHSKGISQLEYKNQKLSIVRNFGVEHGVKIGELDFLSVVDSTLIFAIDKKSYELDINEAKLDTIKLFGNISTAEAYSDEEIEIKFDCIEYNFGNRINYKYRLSPIDTSWSHTNNESVVYRYLPPDDYTFEVEMVHPLRLPSKSYAVNFTVFSHWYQSKITYFILLSLLLLLSRFFIRIKVLNFSKQRLYVWFLNILKPKKRNSINIKDIKGGLQIILLDEIKYLKASGNYVEYHLKNAKIITRSTLKNSLEDLNNSYNLRQVHRSYIVNLDMVNRINQKTLVINEEEVPYSVTYREVIDKYLGNVQV